jgi:hypothetical protein
LKYRIVDIFLVFLNALYQYHILRVLLTEVLLIIPTWSRASRATFESLAQAVGFTVTYGPRTAPFDGLSEGLSSGFGGVEKISKGHYEFYYKTNLAHLVFNEDNQAFKGVGGVFFRLIQPTPYHFLEAGQKAFIDFSKTVSLPDQVISSRKL